MFPPGTASCRRGRGEPMTETPDRLAGTPEIFEELLRVVHLSSAVFLRAEFTEPWGFASLDLREAGALLGPDAERVIFFHVVLEGSCAISIGSGERAFLGPREGVLLPYGARESTRLNSSPQHI